MSAIAEEFLILPRPSEPSNGLLREPPLRGRHHHGGEPSAATVDPRARFHLARSPPRHPHLAAAMAVAVDQHPRRAPRWAACDCMATRRHRPLSSPSRARRSLVQRARLCQRTSPHGHPQLLRSPSQEDHMHNRSHSIRMRVQPRRGHRRLAEQLLVGTPARLHRRHCAPLPPCAGAARYIEQACAPHAACRGGRVYAALGTAQPACGLAGRDAAVGPGPGRRMRWGSPGRRPAHWARAWGARRRWPARTDSAVLLHE
jgi:hypothetical protein